MNEFLIAYLIVIVSNIGLALGAAVCVGAVFLALWWFATGLAAVGDANGDVDVSKVPDVLKLSNKTRNKTFPILLAFMLALQTLCPTKEQMMYIVGIGIGIKAANSDVAQRIPDVAQKLIDDFLKEEQEKKDAAP